MTGTVVAKLPGQCRTQPVQAATVTETSRRLGVAPGDSDGGVVMTGVADRRRLELFDFDNCSGGRCRPGCRASGTPVPAS